MDGLEGKIAIGCFERHHHSAELCAFLNKVGPSAAAELKAHLALDNSKTQKTELIHGRLQQHRRYHLHLVPMSALWLYLAECRFSV